MADHQQPQQVEAAMPPSAPSPSQPTFLEELKAGDKTWMPKTALRTILLVADIIGIGAVGWIVSNSHWDYNSQAYLLDMFMDTYWMPWGLIPLCISLIWGGILIAVFLIRKRPIHPGAVVTLDLLLWLAFLVTALAAMAGVLSVSSFGNDPDYLDDVTYHSSYSGHYHLESNGTWVYNVTSSYRSSSYSEFYNETSHRWEYDTTTPAQVQRDCTPYFDTCAEQDDWVNSLWKQKPRRLHTALLGAVIQFIAILLHFILFVWACVDTNRYRRSRTSDSAQHVAERIIQDMAQRGQITINQPMTQPLLAHPAFAYTRSTTPPSPGPSTAYAGGQPPFPAPYMQQATQPHSYIYPQSYILPQPYPGSYEKAPPMAQSAATVPEPPAPALPPRTTTPPSPVSPVAPSASATATTSKDVDAIEPAPPRV